MCLELYNFHIKYQLFLKTNILNITCLAKISAGQDLTCVVKSSRTKRDTPGDVAVPICLKDITEFAWATCSTWFVTGLPIIILYSVKYIPCEYFNNLFKTKINFNIVYQECIEDKSVVAPMFTERLI